MCFFHVKFNCKKNYQNYGLTLDDWNSDIEKDIDLLHCPMSLAEFELRKKKILDKWESKGWARWLSYFNKEWLLNARFNNWQMFKVPPGIPNTNNPIESFNKILKLIYTNYNVLSIHELLKTLINKLVNFLSVEPKSSNIIVNQA